MDDIFVYVILKEFLELLSHVPNQRITFGLNRLRIVLLHHFVHCTELDLRLSGLISRLRDHLNSSIDHINVRPFFKNNPVDDYRLNNLTNVFHDLVVFKVHFVSVLRNVYCITALIKFITNLLLVYHLIGYVIYKLDLILFLRDLVNFYSIVL